MGSLRNWARYGERMPHATLTTVGAALLLAGTTIEFVTALLSLGPAFAAGGWVLAGGGMGLLFPRINTLVLDMERAATEIANIVTENDAPPTP